MIATLQAMPPTRRRLLLACAVAMLATLPFLSALDNALLWDAEAQVLDDPSIRSFAHLPSWFLQPGTQVVDEGVGQVVYWRPLVKAVLAAIWAVSGPEPLGYNLANVAFNAGAAALLFLLVEATTGRVALAALAAALWAVNPTHVEAVAWAYGLSNTLYGALAFGMLLAWHQGRRLLAGGLFCAALLVREDAALLPGVVLLYEVLVRGDRRPVQVLPFVGVLALYLGVRGLVAGPPPVSVLPGREWLHGAAWVLARYVKIVAWPDAPVALYPLRDLGLGEMAVAWAIVGALFVGFVALLRLRRDLAFWLALVVLAVAPWFNVGRFGEWLLTEKGAYVASAGLCVLAAAALLRVPGGRVFAGAALVAHLVVTLGRAPLWDEPVRWFEAAVASTPTSPTVRYALGLELAEEGHYARAADQFQAVLELAPNHSLAMNNLGNCLWAMGDAEAAAPWWTRALLADPDNAQAAFNLGMMAERRGDLHDAVRYYRQYLESAPDAPPDLAGRIRDLSAVVEGGG